MTRDKRITMFSFPAWADLESRLGVHTSFTSFLFYSYVAIVISVNGTA